MLKELSDAVVGLLWSPVLVYLLLAVGFGFSFCSRFLQVRHWGEMLRLLLNREKSEKGISSFQSLATSLSGRVGMGNIIGVSAAIGFGGPGAVFWMWVTAFLGAATSYVECTLAQLYKQTDPLTGEYRGGPAYYFDQFQKGGKFSPFWKTVSIVIAIATAISCALFLPMVQANGIISAVTNTAGKGGEVIGGIGLYVLIAMSLVLFLLGFIIFGGVKRISNFAEVIVPFMALGYIVLALIIVVLHIKEVPSVFKLIVSDAFTAQAGFGAAIGWGVKRGALSNEAGLGTATHVAAAAEVKHPAQQGLVQAFAVYIDTLFVCTATALMILLTKQYNIQGTLELGNFLVQNLPAETPINSPAFVQSALGLTFGGFAPWFSFLALFFFAFTTIISFYYIAETNTVFLSTKFKINSRIAIFITRLAIMLAVAYGSVAVSDLAWNMGDIGNGILGWINVIGILLIYFISMPTIKCLLDYEAQKKAGVKDYIFDPIKLGIKNATFWEERLKEQQSKVNLDK